MHIMGFCFELSKIKINSSKFIHAEQKCQYSAKIADGESAIEMWNRQKKFIADLIKEEKQKILICSHGRAIRALLCQMLGLPLSKMDTFNHSNLCLYRLGYNSGKFSLLHANLTDHLRMD